MNQFLRLTSTKDVQFYVNMDHVISIKPRHVQDADGVIVVLSVLKYGGEDKETITVKEQPHEIMNLLNAKK